MLGLFVSLDRNVCSVFWVIGYVVVLCCWFVIMFVKYWGVWWYVVVVGVWWDLFGECVLD